MPTFDYKCPSCHRKIKNEFVHSYKDKVKCIQCGAIMSKLFPDKVFIEAFPNGGIYLEHVGAKGKTFKSKREMRKYEKENNVELGYLL